MSVSSERSTDSIPRDVRIEPESVTACLLCGSSRLRRWRRSFDRSHLISHQRFVYSRCRDCGLCFESTRPAEEDIDRFYPATYYNPTQTAVPPRAARARRAPRRGLSLARLLLDSLPSRLREVYEPGGSRTFLDYGCGSAAFLDRARADGWTNTIGVDISERVLAEVRERGHRALAAEPSTWDELDNASVSLVRMNHVIEHLYRPREVLAAVLRKLEVGGMLHVATPNPTSWPATVLRSYWLGLDCPRHVLLHPPATLVGLLREVGFRRVEVFHEVLTKDTARSLGHVLHALGRLPHSEILAMADRERLAGALQLPARLAARAGRSDRFHCFAQK